MGDQFQIIDINRWWRTGGTNYPKLLENCEHVIIQACAGVQINELIEEQIEGVLAAGGKYETYGIPAHDIDGATWADFYMSIPGVMEAPKWIDIEPTGGAMASLSNVTKARSRVNSRSPGPAGIYSNYNYITKLGTPSWVFEDDVWWAEYPYHYVFPKWVKYEHFDTFFKDKAWWPGKWSARLGISPILLQFTDKGRAQEYGANPTTDHPVYTTGIQSADLNAGLITYANYSDRRFGPYEDTGGGTDPDMAYILATLADHEERLNVLEGNENDNPAPPPDPSPELAGDPYVVKADTTVAWKQSGSNSNGVPIFDTNAHILFGDPTLKWKKGDNVRLFRPPVIGANGTKYLKAAQTPVSYGDLYLKQPDVMKLF